MHVLVCIRRNGAAVPIGCNYNTALLKAQLSIAWPCQPNTSQNLWLAFYLRGMPSPGHQVLAQRLALNQPDLLVMGRGGGGAGAEPLCYCQILHTTKGRVALVAQVQLREGEMNQSRLGENSLARGGLSFQPLSRTPPLSGLP